MDLRRIRIYSLALSLAQIQADMRTSVGGISAKVSLEGDSAFSTPKSGGIGTDSPGCRAVGIEGPMLAGILGWLRRRKRAGSPRGGPRWRNRSWGHIDADGDPD